MKVTIVRSRAIDASVYKLANLIAEEGHTVKLLVWDRQAEIKQTDLNFELVTFRLKAPYDHFLALLLMPFWWIYIFYFIFRDDSDVYHFCDLDTLIPGVFTQKVKNKPIFYTIFDYYANILPTSQSSFVNFVRYSVSSLENYLLRFTEVVFVVDINRIQDIRGSKIKHLGIIYNSPPDYRFSESRNIEDDINNKFVIFYAGVLIENRGILNIIEIVKELSDIYLVIAGNGPLQEKIKSDASNFKNIEYLGYIPYSEVLKRTILSDVLIALYNPKIPQNLVASPNKLFEAMMTSKPIIMNRGIGLEKLFNRHKNGILVDYNNKNDLVSTLLRLKEDSKLRDKLGENGRHAYEKHYSWNLMKKRIMKHYGMIEKFQIKPL